jgi:hypothetical protein
MKYREMISYRKGYRELIGAIILRDGEIEFDGIPELIVEGWKRDGIVLGNNRFKPDENPDHFFACLPLTNTSYIKIGPVYEEE